MKKFSLFILIILLSVFFFACSNEPEVTDPTGLDDLTTIDEKVAWWIDHLSIEEKAGQMIQAERSTNNGQSGATAQEVTTYYLGSVLNGGGNVPNPNTVPGWLSMSNLYRNASLNTPSGIPIIYGVDAVHGHNNLKDATIFPHNIGLAAANNPELMRAIGEATAYELAQTGMQMNFSPSIGLISDKRWGRVYETLGEDPAVALNLIAPYIEGLQEYQMIATAKHFIGDGYTIYGTGINGRLDRGNAEISEEDLYNIHLPLYQEAIDAGVKSIMISYSALNGIRMHQFRNLITNVLKNDMGFRGFVISDYEATNDVTGVNLEQKIIATVNAGVDMLMEPNRFDQAYDAIIAGYNKGLISIDRINDAVSRILTVKYEVGLFDNHERPAADLRNENSLAIARQAVRESLVLLKNENQILPLSKSENLLIIGPGSHDIGIQSGGWTMTWQGLSGMITEGTSILDGMKAVHQGNIYTSMEDIALADKVVLVLAEKPAAEMFGDSDDLALGGATAYEENVTLLESVIASGKPVIVILVSGKPLLMTDYIADIDGFVMAFLPGSEGAGVADVLYGDFDFKGKLPYTYPMTLSQSAATVLMNDYHPEDYLYPYGFGLTYGN